jgi:hypothetical protein
VHCHEYVEARGHCKLVTATKEIDMDQRNHQLRAGKVLAFTSPDGAVRPQAFWCLSQFSLDVEAKRLSIVYIAYHTKEDYDAGRAAIRDATQPYLFEGAAFDALVAANPDFVATLLQRTWAVALETPDGPLPAEGQPDTRVSFFHSAIDAQ